MLTIICRFSLFLSLSLSLPPPPPFPLFPLSLSISLSLSAIYHTPSLPLSSIALGHLRMPPYRKRIQIKVSEIKLSLVVWLCENLRNFVIFYHLRCTCEWIVKCPQKKKNSDPSIRNWLRFLLPIKLCLVDPINGTK